MISVVRSDAEIESIFARAKELGNVFDAHWCLQMWSGVLAQNLGVILRQHEGGRVEGAMGLLIAPALDAELESREIFWFGGNLALLRMAESWSVDIGAKRLVLGCPENDRYPALARVRRRDGYKLIEHMYVKEL